MNELSNILRKKMVNHGYLEFNRPEPKILVDENCHPYQIDLRSQKTGEKLIENFMIVANETVAGYIEDMNVPGIYRVHDKPNKEKLQAYGLKRIVDFRTPDEVEKAPDKEIEGVVWTFNPIIKALTLGITKKEDAFKREFGNDIINSDR